METIRIQLKIKILMTCLLVTSALSYITYRNSKDTTIFIVFLIISVLTTMLLLIISRKNKVDSSVNSIDIFIVFDEDERSLKLDIKARRKANDIIFRILILLFFGITILNIRMIPTVFILIIWGAVEVMKEFIYYRDIRKRYVE